MLKNKRSPKPWPLIRSQTGPDLNISKVRFDWRKNPRNGIVLKGVVLEASDWINVVALTSEKQVIVIQQYRFGIDKISAEIPGGLMEPGESPQEAAIRELREETGYTSDQWICLGSTEPNPAFLNNLCHHWLALNVQKSHTTQLDDGEDLAVFKMSLPELRDAFRSGEMRHALDISALSRVFNLWGKREDGLNLISNE